MAMVGWMVYLNANQDLLAVLYIMYFFITCTSIGVYVLLLVIGW